MLGLAPDMQIGSPRLTTLTQKKNTLKYSFSAYRGIGRSIVAAPFFAVLIIMAYLAVALIDSVSAHELPVASSFENSIEKKILDDYMYEADIIRERYKEVRYFDANHSVDQQTIERMIFTRLVGLKGEYSVSSTHLGTKENISYQNQDKHIIASIAKLFVSALVVKHDGSDTAMRGGVYAMLHASNNDYFSAYVRRFGINKIQDFIDQLGITQVSFKDNTGTARSIDDFLIGFYRGDVLQPGDQEVVLRAMTNTTNEERLPASLPADVRIAHKIGTWDGNYNDAGIVYTAFGDYTIVFLTSEASPAEAISAAQDISRMIYEYWKIKTPINENREHTQ